MASFLKVHCTVSLCCRARIRAAACGDSMLLKLMGHVPTTTGPAVSHARFTIESGAARDLSNRCAAAVEGSILPAVDVHKTAGAVSCTVAEHSIRPQGSLQQA